MSAAYLESTCSLRLRAPRRWRLARCSGAGAGVHSQFAKKPSLGSHSYAAVTVLAWVACRHSINAPLPSSREAEPVLDPETGEPIEPEAPNEVRWCMYRDTVCGGALRVRLLSAPLYRVLSTV
jgi:hypothetical protein